MGAPSPSLLTLALASSLAFIATSTLASGDEAAFIGCLIENSHPSYPIAPAIYTPENASYAPVLQAYIRNLRFNTSTTPKPRVIVTALHESHVQAAVICGRENSLQVKIRSGGHNYEGISYYSLSESPFFILDMFNLRTIEVDVANGTAWVQTGATLGELYYRIANESGGIYGFPGGVCPTVGVGGHLSGGGYGNMMRKHGLTVDHVVDALMVDVNGRILDRVAMGEDLFWAIRGGGGASFGVVLAYKVNLVRVPETVTVFRVARTLEQNATDVVYKWEQVAPHLDEDLFIRLIIDVVNSTTPQNGTAKTVRASFLALFLGNSTRLLSITNESFPELGLEPSDCTEMSWVESVLYWTSFPAGTPVEALLSRTPQVLNHFKRKSDYVKRPIPIEGLEYIFARMIELVKPILTFNPYGGKMAEIASTATPFPHRAGNLWKVQYAANWDEDGEEAAAYYIGLTRKLYEYMTPFVSKNPREAFLNYIDLDLGINRGDEAAYTEAMAYGVKYFKGNYKRLISIKTRVDPQNYFRNEQSIPILPRQRS
ncbi:hypothetical protein SAY86_003231 [Trapa natans]|uniref:FAD-binding PCMH-type domain-containing protein n=1 Tax=Trapa natans TaxID=22666 RepID=A0AAN7MDS1_TRANT|nr:hypothetical protein SAY86_003231 [Trapa natans]